MYKAEEINLQIFHFVDYSTGTSAGQKSRNNVTARLEACFNRAVDPPWFRLSHRGVISCPIPVGQPCHPEADESSLNAVSFQGHQASASVCLLKKLNTGPFDETCGRGRSLLKASYKFRFLTKKSLNCVELL